MARFRPSGGGFSHRRCHAAGSRRYMGRLRAATGSGSGARRPASGLPQVGAVLLRLLPQIRSFPSRSNQPWPFSRQARIQKPDTGPEEPGFRRRRRSDFGITRPGPWRPTASGSLSFRPLSEAAPLPSWEPKRCAASCQTWPCGRAWPPRRRTRRSEPLRVEG